MESIGGDGGGALPDLTGDGGSDLDDFLLFAAATDETTSSAASRSGCGCALIGAALMLAALLA